MKGINEKRMFKKEGNIKIIKDAGSEKELGEKQESSTEISGYKNNEI